MPDTYFSIPVLLPDMDVLTFLSIHQKDKTFETELLGEPIALLYLGEGSWNLIKGEIEQGTVSVIGQSIEDHHLNKH